MSNRSELDLNRDEIRAAIQKEYQLVAEQPHHGFHFHTGRPLLIDILGYEDEWLQGIADEGIDSSAGTGNPFAMGALQPGENIELTANGSISRSCNPRRKVGADRVALICARSSTASCMSL